MVVVAARSRVALPSGGMRAQMQPEMLQAVTVRRAWRR